MNVNSNWRNLILELNRCKINCPISRQKYINEMPAFDCYRRILVLCGYLKHGQSDSTYFVVFNPPKNLNYKYAFNLAYNKNLTLKQKIRLLKLKEITE
jgi:hypothetical protein